MPEKLVLKFGEQVLVKNTGGHLDGLIVTVVGVSVRHIIDIYILALPDGKKNTMPDGMEYTHFCMPEACLERVAKEMSEYGNN